MIFSFKKKIGVRFLFGFLLFNTWEPVHDAHETKLVALGRKTTD